MKLQSFCLEVFQVPTKHGFLYLSPLLSKWNQSKLPIFIKFYTIRRKFCIFKNNDLRNFSLVLGGLASISLEILKNLIILSIFIGI